MDTGFPHLPQPFSTEERSKAWGAQSSDSCEALCPGPRPGQAQSTEQPQPFQVPAPAPLSLFPSGPGVHQYPCFPSVCPNPNHFLKQLETVGWGGEGDAGCILQSCELLVKSSGSGSKIWLQQSLPQRRVTCPSLPASEGPRGVLLPPDSRAMP